MKKFTEQELNKVYEDFLEQHEESAPNEIMQSYKALIAALEDYISSITELEWKNGFKYAFRIIEKEVQ